MKKFTTLALAGAMVAAMSCSAFAGTVNYSGLSDEDSYGVFVNPGKYVSDITAVGSVEFTVDGIKEANGCYEVSANSDSWGWDPVNLTDDNVTTGVVVCPCSFTADDADESGAGFAKVQMQYWADGEITVTRMVIKDTAGAVLYDSAPAAPSGDVAPVAYLAAIVAVAGIAMVASKKRA